jgi:thiol-disulfide isomerase/thioredoxin
VANRLITSRRALLAALAALAIGAGIAVALHFREPPGLGGDALLAVSLPDAAGASQTLGQWRGKLLVVNFWATWCAPCREEMPMFVKAQAEHGSRGLQFVGIAVDDAEKVRQFASEIGVNYPTLIGGYGAMELSKSLGNSLMALPFTVVVDRGGRIVMRQLGPVKQAQLDALVKQSLPASGT